MPDFLDKSCDERERESAGARMVRATPIFMLDLLLYRVMCGTFGCDPGRNDDGCRLKVGWDRQTTPYNCDKK